MYKKGDLNSEQIRFIYENALENIITIDNNGKILFTSHSLLFNGHNIKELIGKPIFSFVDSKDKKILEYYLKKCKQGKSNEVFEIAFINPSGRKLWHEIKCQYIKSADNTENYIIFARDISKRKKLENKLKKINQNLEEIVKQRTLKMQEAISDLEGFSYSVSHDLKAPLRAIKGYSSILNEELGETRNEDVQDSILSISRNIDKMDKLIADILSFSRIGRSKTSMQPVNFKKIFDEKMKELLYLEPNRYVNYTIDNDLPTLFFDQPMAKQLAQNLLSNALKYTSKNEYAEIKVGMQKKGKDVVLFVKDNGVGFDENYKDKLFMVFQRLHSENEFSGSGIGLALVKRIMNKHNGNVWGEGKITEGATFFLSFPKKILCHEKK